MTQPEKSRAMGMAAVMAAACLWGTTGVTASLAPEVGPLAIGAAAMGGGGLLQALLASPEIGRCAGRIRRRLGFIVLAGLSVALYPLAFYGSMRLAGITAGTVISIGAAPAMAALIEWAASGRRPSGRFGAAAALGAAGIGLIAAGRSGAASGGSSAAGILCALLAALTYAYYSWAAARLMRGGIPRKAAMGSLFGIGAMLLLPVLLFTGGPFLNSPGNLAVGLYMASVPMFLGYICFGCGLARIEASDATAISLLEPVVAAALAALIAHERLAPLAWCGTGLIFLSLGLLLFAPVRRREALQHRT